MNNEREEHINGLRAQLQAFLEGEEDSNVMLVVIEGYKTWVNLTNMYAYAYDEKKVYPRQIAEKIWSFKR